MISKITVSRMIALLVSASCALFLSGCLPPCNDSMSLVKRLECENFGLPSTPGQASFGEPKTLSTYQICPVSLSSLTEEEVFDCAEETFWHGFSDGRLSVRESAEQSISSAINANQQSENNARLAKLYNLRGDLRMAMALENGVSIYLIGDRYISGDLRKALQINPGYVPAQAFLDTMDVAYDILFNRWSSAISNAEASLARIDQLKGADPHMYTGAAFSVSGTYMAFPLATGLAQRAVTQMTDAGCPDTLYWCADNTLHAPYAAVGLAYHFAEMHARVGNRVETEQFLQKAQAANGYEQWKYKYYVEDAQADLDGFMAKYAAYGQYRTPMSILYANGNVGCSFCHTRQ